MPNKAKENIMRKFILLSRALEVIVIYASSKTQAYSIARQMGYEV